MCLLGLIYNVKNMNFKMKENSNSIEEVSRQ